MKLEVKGYWEYYGYCGGPDKDNMENSDFSELYEL